VDSNELDVASAIPLVEQIIRNQPSSEVWNDASIWDAVFEFVAQKIPVTPPNSLAKSFDTPPRSSLSTQVGAYMDDTRDIYEESKVPYAEGYWSCWSEARNQNPDEHRDGLRQAQLYPTTPSDTFKKRSTTNLPLDGLWFPRFLELPKEIRRMIWYAALPGPRIVVIRERLLRKICRWSGANLEGIWSKGTAPSLLFVCRESREIASKFYVESFSRRYYQPFPETYFNFENATLYLRFDFFNIPAINYLVDKALNIADTERVHNLTILWDPRYSDRTDFHTPVALILWCFPRLKKLTIVIHDFCQESAGDILFIEPMGVGAACSTELSDRQDLTEQPFFGWLLDERELGSRLEEERIGSGDNNDEDEDFYMGPNTCRELNTSGLSRREYQRASWILQRHSFIHRYLSRKWKK
jgi:hypothetical protein